MELLNPSACYMPGIQGAFGGATVVNRAALMKLGNGFGAEGLDENKRVPKHPRPLRGLG